MNSSKFIGVITAGMLVASGVTLANASEIPVVADRADNSVQGKHEGEDLAEIADSIESSDVPRAVVEKDDMTYTSYTLESGMKLNIPETEPSHPVDGGISPFLSAGPSKDGPWVELTPLEQEMAVGGGAAGFTALICGSGPWSCAVASAITAGIVAYIAKKGVCPNNQRLLMEFSWVGTTRGGACR